MSMKPDSPRDFQNKADLLEVLERLHKQDLFCPACGNAMFQCSKCHKTLDSLLELKGPIAKNIQRNSEENAS
jgi:tRNA(Ile2) C34 agmatinyltransferase TiaS